MKAWKKSRNLSRFGEPYIIWYHKAVNRFVVKIFTWLLSAFVAGILTALVCHHLNLVDAGQTLARIVFFLVFITGIIDALLENIVIGVDYRVTDKALLHVKPFFLLKPVFGLFGNKVASLAQRVEYIEWPEVESYKQDPEKPALSVELKKSQMVQVGVAPVKHYRLPLSNQEYKSTDQRIDSKDKFSKQAMNHILSKIRQAKSF
jgi:hypothetical protein